MSNFMLPCLGLVLLTVAVTRGYPLHASCTIDWFFKAQCDKVNEAIVSQIKEWAGPENCQKAGGEKCLYKLKSSSSSEIKVVHETPKAHYLDDISLTFVAADAGCKVHGHSSSETWYAILDKGTNYCNMHNLITGSGLDKSPGYNETTSNSECTEYSSADCSVY